MTDEMLRLLEVTAYNFYIATLVGDPAPITRAANARMRVPQVGDTVLEVSTIYDEARLGTRIGRLERTAREPFYTAEEWAEQGGADEPIPTHDVWYIRLPGGREYRWHNARFIAIPETIRGWESPSAPPTERAND